MLSDISQLPSEFETSQMGADVSFGAGTSLRGLYKTAAQNNNINKSTVSYGGGFMKH